MTPRHPHLLPAESGPQALVNSGHHRYYLARHIALRACRLAAALGLVATACHSLPEPRTLDAGRLGRVELFAPSPPAHGLVFLFSDAGGWSAPLEQVARRLVARGAAVVGVDLRRYLDGLARSADDCHYVVADLEELSHRLERETDFLRYRSPVLAGLGQGPPSPTQHSRRPRRPRSPEPPA